MTPNHWITNPYLFYGASALLVGYVLYMMVRGRRGERPGQEDGEAEL